VQIDVSDESEGEDDRKSRYAFHAGVWTVVVVETAAPRGAQSARFRLALSTLAFRFRSSVVVWKPNTPVQLTRTLHSRRRDDARSESKGKSRQRIVFAFRLVGHVDLHGSLLLLLLLLLRELVDHGKLSRYAFHAGVWKPNTPVQLTRTLHSRRRDDARSESKGKSFFFSSGR
jgi:hypothetical protein